MKNRLFERHRRLQKQYAKKGHQNYPGGIVVRHVYDSEPADRLTWWDDTGFRINGVHVSVWWVHPRMKYNDTVDDIAHTTVPYSSFPSQETASDDPFADAKPFFKMVGKSGKRKKQIGYSGNFSSKRPGWYEAVTAEKDRLLLDNDLAVAPSFKVEALDWCRGVSICVPMEVRGVDDLKKLCVLVKALLKGETTLEKEFPGYRYTKEDWARENPPVEKVARFPENTAPDAPANN